MPQILICLAYCPSNSWQVVLKTIWTIISNNFPVLSFLKAKQCACWSLFCSIWALEDQKQLKLQNSLSDFVTSFSKTSKNSKFVVRFCEELEKYFWNRCVVFFADKIEASSQTLRLLIIVLQHLSFGRPKSTIKTSNFIIRFCEELPKNN